MQPTNLQAIVSDYMGSAHVDLGQTDPEISPIFNKSSHLVNTIGAPGTRPSAPIIPMERAAFSTME